ncbi:hypothetical protein D9M72_507390 [compost metagenome]
MPNIARREHPGNAGFQRQPSAPQMAELSRNILKISPGEHKAVVIQGEGTLQPFCVRHRPDENEEVSGVEDAPFACGSQIDDDPFEGA